MCTVDQAQDGACSYPMNEKKMSRMISSLKVHSPPRSMTIVNGLTDSIKQEGILFPFY
jgi:hypothetical protein